MHFKVIRKDIVIGEIDTTRKNDYQFKPVDNILLLRGDILEATDGARLEVISYNPAGKLRAGIMFRLLE